MNAGQITASLLLRIPEEIPGARVWRQNVIAAKVGDRFVRAGLPGMADISGILPGGKRVEVEVKGPGDRLSEQQKSFRSMIQKSGGVYVVARDVDAAIAEIRSAA